MTHREFELTLSAADRNDGGIEIDMYNHSLNNRLAYDSDNGVWSLAWDDDNKEDTKEAATIIGTMTLLLMRRGYHYTARTYTI